MPSQSHSQTAVLNALPMVQSAANAIAERIQRACGLGNVLQVGSHTGTLVAALNEKGFAAHGVDFSNANVLSADRLCPDRFALLTSFRPLPYQDKAFDFLICTVDLHRTADADAEGFISEMGRVARKAVYIVSGSPLATPSLPMRSREELEQLSFRAGLRKHPAYYSIVGYEAPEQEKGEFELVLEPILPAAAALFPMESLRAERDLHMDMTREAGRRSDAHIYRYHQAAQVVRPGDRVLDLACGLGYGSRVLKEMSLASMVHGVDSSLHAIEYARVNFADPKGTVLFEREDAVHFLERTEAGAYDVIVSLETLEYLLDPKKFLSECQRVLTPGGRLYVSVPNDWTEADGKDPNPYHFHVYTLPKFVAELQSFFFIEKLVAQSASRRKEYGVWAGRAWRELEVGSCISAASEWCVALAMKDPSLLPKIEFFDTVYPFHGPGDTKPAVIDFEKQYLNPWLIRSAVAIGLRTDSKRILRGLAEGYVNQATASADGAAMLCVEAYRLLEEGAAWAVVVPTIERAEPYVRERDWTAAPPIEVRWAVSLLYVAALLQQRAGRQQEATRSLERCAAIPFERYSPILATKTIDALFRLGLSYWRDRDTARAQVAFLSGIDAAQRAVSENWQSAFCAPAQVPEFFLAELAEILESSKRCLVALKFLPQGSPTGRVLLAVQWNRPWELANMRASLRGYQADWRDRYPQLARLEALVTDYECAKREWFEPELKRLSIALNGAHAEREELQRERKRLQEEVEQVRRIAREQREKELGRLNTGLAKEQAATKELMREMQELRARLLAQIENKNVWFDAELKKQSRIDELEARLGHLAQFEASRSYRAWLKYQKLYGMPVIGPLLRALRQALATVLRRGAK
jgi:SAM-dependent methyltransferase